MSGLFGGLLEPGEGAKFAIERHLKSRRESWLRRKPPEWLYAGPEDFILQHGTYFQGAACPDEYMAHVGVPRLCYANAAVAAREHPELTYYEGVYDVGAGATSHAWCVDANGAIVELTFQPQGGTDYVLDRSVRGLDNPHFAYYGVPLHHAYVDEHWKHYGLGVLREGCGLRILTYPYDPDRTTP